MMSSVLIAILVLLSGGLACGGAQPLGRARPRAESPLEPAGGPLGSDGSQEAGEVGISSEEDLAWQASDEPLYAVSTRITSPGGATHIFLLTVPSIGAGARFDLARAVELPDVDSPAFGTRGRPFAYSASAFEPTVTRWRVRADGWIEQNALSSFASLGRGRADSAGALSFFAHDKAYFSNPMDPSQIVIWNPETLAIRGSISLDLPLIDQMRPQVLLSQRADRLLAVVSWQEAFASNWTHFGDRVQVISIDPSRDAVIGRTEESRCNQFSWVSRASDGTAYFSPAAYYAPLRALLGPENGIDSRALRIPPGADSFEPGYDVELPSLTGDRPAGDFFLVSGSTAFLRVWHSELVTPLSDGNQNWEAVMQEPGFLWWSWHVGAEQAERVPDQRPSRDVQTFVVDDATYTATVSEDGASSSLDQLAPEGILRPGLTGPGQMIGVFRLR
jgi:hypothetical protein